MKRCLLRLRSIHSDESGLFAVSHLATTLFLMVGSICLYNMGAALTDRTRHQRQADAVAQSLGVWKARNLNAVVSHQHLMGELVALVLTHHAIGGDELDQQRVGDTSEADRRLRDSHGAARGARSGTPAFGEVSSRVLAGEALLIARRRLKQLLSKVYDAKAAATAMQAYPPTQPAGAALEKAAHQLELAILAEWRVLDQVHAAARSLSPLKMQIVAEFMPDAKERLDTIIENYPLTQRQIADQLSDSIDAQIHILPSDQRLPVIEDPWARRFSLPDELRPETHCDCPTGTAENMRHQITKITQLARATFPWVNYHREPIERQLKPITPLSGMADLFFDHTNGVSKRMLDERQREGQWSLYVLDDYEGPDKGIEAWTRRDGSAAADKTFGISIVIGKRVREPVGSVFFLRKRGEYSYRYSSAMVWNRLPADQRPCRIDLSCKRIVPSTQSSSGWDLLNWSPHATVSELVGIGVPHVLPEILPSWSSQLSPTSAARLSELREQPLPDWGQGVRDDLPARINPDLLNL